MSNILNTKSFTVPAGVGQNQLVAVPGTTIQVLGCNQPTFTISVGGHEDLTVSEGFTIPFGEFNKFIITNQSATLPLIVTLNIGNFPITDNRPPKNPSVYSFANGGSASAAFLNGQGFITLSNGNFPNGLKLSGTNQGRRRQQAIITVKPNGGSGLLIYDDSGAGGTAGNLLMFVNAPSSATNAIVVVQNDTTMILKQDTSGVPLVAVWEMFYNE